jgi:CHAT domain-containing protein
MDPAPKGEGRSDKRRLAAFVVRPDQKRTTLVPLGFSRDLTELVGRWRSSYGQGKVPPRGEPDPSVELRKRVWEPLAKHLEGAKVVLVSPDGPLLGLPLAALPGSKKGAFLIDEYAFATVPIPQLLPELLRGRSAPPRNPSSLVVGNIDFDALSSISGATKQENNFPPLPGTKAEAAAVHDLFRKTFADSPAELLSGKGATREAFVSRAPNYSHLLVATHGFYFPEPERKVPSDQGQQSSLDALLLRSDLVSTNPALRSGLAFAGANHAVLGRQSAFLTAFEASELDLRRVDLAVLSACETGLGQVERGEGMLGLQRAFQLAGARTAVTSLWKVPDGATRALIARFHENLWQGRQGKRMGKLEALREAQQWFIKEAAVNPDLIRGRLVRPSVDWKPGDPVSPYFWAAFVLSGDWR